jgi:hypothetical protein
MEDFLNAQDKEVYWRASQSAETSLLWDKWYYFT